MILADDNEIFVTDKKEEVRIKILTKRYQIMEYDATHWIDEDTIDCDEDTYFGVITGAEFKQFLNKFENEGYPLLDYLYDNGVFLKAPEPQTKKGKHQVIKYGTTKPKSILKYYNVLTHP